MQSAGKGTSLGGEMSWIRRVGPVLSFNCQASSPRPITWVKAGFIPAKLWVEPFLLGYLSVLGYAGEILCKFHYKSLATINLISFVGELSKLYDFPWYKNG